MSTATARRTEAVYGTVVGTRCGKQQPTIRQSCCGDARITIWTAIRDEPVAIIAALDQIESAFRERSGYLAEPQTGTTRFVV